MPKPISILILHRKRLAFLVAFIMTLVGESKPGIDPLHPALSVQHSRAENATRLTVGNAGHNMAILNNLVIGLCLSHGFDNLAKARRFFSAQPKAAPNLLTSATL